MLPTLYISSEYFARQPDISRIVGIMKGLSVLAAMVAICIFALWLGMPSFKQENEDIETCLQLNQDQVNRLLFLALLLLKVTKLRLESSQLACLEGCHLAEPLLKLHCNVEGWSQAGSEVSCCSL